MRYVNKPCSPTESKQIVDCFFKDCDHTHPEIHKLPFALGYIPHITEDRALIGFSELISITTQSTKTADGVFRVEQCSMRCMHELEMFYNLILCHKFILELSVVFLVSTMIMINRPLRPSLNS